MRTIIQSIHPEHVWNMRHAGRNLPLKRIEVRKTAPKETPFKVLIYETKQKEKRFKSFTVDGVETSVVVRRGGCGKIVGEYICRRVETVRADNAIAVYYNNKPETRLTDEQLRLYGGGKALKFLYMEDVIFYDKPKELGEFRRECKQYGAENPLCDDCRYYDCCNGVDYDESDCVVDGLIPITRPPQSWCYVESV